MTPENRELSINRYMDGIVKYLPECVCQFVDGNCEVAGFTMNTRVEYASGMKTEQTHLFLVSGQNRDLVKRLMRAVSEDESVADKVRGLLNEIAV